MEIDIKNVDTVIQDFQNKSIELKSKEGYLLWQRKYSSESTFNKVFREIHRRFTEELKKREARRANVDIKK